MSLITDKQLDKILDRRDAAVAADFENLRSEIETLLVGMIGAIQLNNLAQPHADDVSVQFFVDDEGYRRATTSDGFERAKLAGRTVFRQVTVLERYAPEPDRLERAQEIVAQVRQEPKG